MVLAWANVSCRLAAGLREGQVDGGALVLGEFAELQQAVDEQAQASVGRQPARGGVGGEEQAGTGEVCHDVADGGRREVEREQARERARADGLAGFDILLDDFTQHGGGADVQPRGQAWWLVGGEFGP